VDVAGSDILSTKDRTHAWELKYSVSENCAFLLYPEVVLRRWVCDPLVIRALARATLLMTGVRVSPTDHSRTSLYRCNYAVVLHKRLGPSNKCAGIIPYSRSFSDEIYWRVREYAAVHSKVVCHQDRYQGPSARQRNALEIHLPQVRITGNR